VIDASIIIPAPCSVENPGSAGIERYAADASRHGSQSPTFELLKHRVTGLVPCERWQMDMRIPRLSWPPGAHRS
jgi:hypothetical protein